MDKNGIVTVSKKAVKQLALYNAEKCDGVVSVKNTSRKKKFSDIILKKDELDRIVVKSSEKGIFIDINVELEQDFDSETVSNAVSESVKASASKMGIDISEVNVFFNAQDE